MSVAFYSDDSELVNRKVPASIPYTQEKALENFYELDNCVKWILQNNFTKVALQFPDDLLNDAASVALTLEQKTEKEIYILGDTCGSYGSCCVDEIAAEHASSDCIIHYGHACLNPTQRLPVLFVFGKSAVDVDDAKSAFKSLFPDTLSHILLIYEVVYTHAIGQLVENLKQYENLVVSSLQIPQKTTTSVNENENLVRFTKCHRCFVIPKSRNLYEYSVFFIGCQEQILTNIMLSLRECKFFTYNPIKKVAQPETLDINRYLKKRYYYIEKTKDAKIIGILVGTLGVSNYLKIISHLRELIKAAGKKSYTLVVGKLNAAKLANFAEIEVFVKVACSESTIIDCHDFYQPIISPYELEIALNEARQWTGDYVTDFSELLPGSAKHIPPTQIKPLESDISLITGKMRASHLSTPAEEHLGDSLSLVARDEMTISAIHSQAAGEFLSQRIWKGLEQKLGETEVSSVQQGRKGIASVYEDETNEPS